jgi:orotate phosphoribosyltransferase
MNVVLIDDTFTSGARLQSAASRLTLDGANVAAAVVVGRFMNPGWSTSAQELWDAADERTFSFDTCCLEGD